MGKIKISGFKSLDGFEIENITPFTVIAGPNGSGKSNFFEAMQFISSVINNDVYKAIRDFGGFKSIHCRKRRKENRTTFNFEIEWPDISEDDHGLIKYHLKISKIDAIPVIYEKYTKHGKVVFERDAGSLRKSEKEKDFSHFMDMLDKHYKGGKLLLSFPFLFNEKSNGPIYQILESVKKFAIDPSSARNSNKSNSVDDVLNFDGSNLVSVLKRIETDEPDVAEQILEILTNLVPSLAKVGVQDNDIDNTISLAFSELGHRKIFPPHLVSDGTIYLLSLLVATLSAHENGGGLTLIEEPERGLHPKAIEEICEIFKEGATWNSPIIINTHSETAVRSIKLENLVFFEKINGTTKAYRPTISSDLDIPLDEAWLTNMLNGGLPK